MDRMSKNTFVDAALYPLLAATWDPEPVAPPPAALWLDVVQRAQQAGIAQLLYPVTRQGNLSLPAESSKKAASSPPLLA